MYCLLAVRYGWGPDIVASMTPAQQLMYASYDERPGGVPAGMNAKEARDALRKKQGKPI